MSNEVNSVHSDVGRFIFEEQAPYLRWALAVAIHLLCPVALKGFWGRGCVSGNLEFKILYSCLFILLYMSIYNPK